MGTAKDRLLQRFQGFSSGDGVHDSSLYFDGHTLYVDVMGDASAGALPAFVVRGLNNDTNRSTDLFTVYKDGTTSVSGGQAGAVGDLSSSYIAITTVTFNNKQLTNAIITNPISNGGVFTNASLASPQLTNAVITGGGSLGNVTITSPVINTPIVTGGSLTNPIITGGSFNAPNITNAIFAGQAFTNASIGNPIVTSGSFAAPNLTSPVIVNPVTTGGSLGSPIITSASLASPRLTSAVISSGSIGPMIITGGSFNAPNITGATFAGQSFTNASLGNPTITGGTTTALDKGGQVYNVLAFGGTMNSPASASANSFAWALAASTARAASGGVIYVPPGIFYHNGNLLFYQGNSYRGADDGVTILTLASGAPANADILRSSTFATQQGIASNSADYNFNISHFMLDGNKANNPSGRHGIAIVGGGYRIENCTIRNCNGSGIWSEYNPVGNVYDLDDAVGLGYGDAGSLISKVKIYGCAANTPAPTANTWSGQAASVRAQLMFAGPHDSAINHVTIYQTGAYTTGVRGLLIGRVDASGAASDSATGTQVDNLQVYLNNDIAVDLAAGPVHLDNLHVEGARLANLVVRPGAPAFIRGMSFLTASGGRGCWFADSGSNGHHVWLEMESIGAGGAAVQFGGGANYSDIWVTAYNGAASAFLYTGSVPPTSRVYILNLNGSLSPFQGISVRQQGAG